MPSSYSSPAPDSEEDSTNSTNSVTEDDVSDRQTNSTMSERSTLPHYPGNQEEVIQWYKENPGKTPPWSRREVEETDTEAELEQIEANPFMTCWWSKEHILCERRKERQRQRAAAAGAGPSNEVASEAESLPPTASDAVVGPADGDVDLILSEVLTTSGRFDADEPDDITGASVIYGFSRDSDLASSEDIATWSESNGDESDDIASSSVVYGFSYGHALADDDLAPGEEIVAIGDQSNLDGTVAITEGNAPVNAEATEGERHINSESLNLIEEGNQAPTTESDGEKESARCKRGSYIIALDDEEYHSPKRRRRTIRMEIPGNRTPFRFKMIVEDVGKAIAIIGKVTDL